MGYCNGSSGEPNQMTQEQIDKILATLPVAVHGFNENSDGPEITHWGQPLSPTDPSEE